MAQEVATHWTLDKRIPLGLVGAILFQTLALGMWIQKQDSRIENAENRLAQIEAAEKDQAVSRRVNIDRLSRLEVDYSTTKNEINRRLDRMEQKVDQILERLPRP